MTILRERIHVLNDPRALVVEIASLDWSDALDRSNDSLFWTCWQANAFNDTRAGFISIARADAVRVFIARQGECAVNHRTALSACLEEKDLDL